jgi:hypothetical protein
MAAPPWQQWIFDIGEYVLTMIFSSPQQPPAAPLYTPTVEPLALPAVCLPQKEKDTK